MLYNVSLCQRCVSVVHHRERERCSPLQERAVLTHKFSSRGVPSVHRSFRAFMQNPASGEVSVDTRSSVWSAANYGVCLKVSAKK